jgi:hypothetical protein
MAAGAALMPDAHVGYGLPIGGVLALENAVIPYAVGVDIACRMKLSILDLPPSTLDDDFNRFKEAIEGGTRFGIGSTHEKAKDRYRWKAVQKDLEKKGVRVLFAGAVPELSPRLRSLQDRRASTLRRWPDLLTQGHRPQPRARSYPVPRELSLCHNPIVSSTPHQPPALIV